LVLQAWFILHDFSWILRMDFFITGVAPSVHAWRDYWHHKCASKYNSIGCITACSASRNTLIEADSTRLHPYLYQKMLAFFKTS
jgi:hypothetical protein